MEGSWGFRGQADIYFQGRGDFCLQEAARWHGVLGTAAPVELLEGLDWCHRAPARPATQALNPGAFLGSCRPPFSCFSLGFPHPEG